MAHFSIEDYKDGNFRTQRSSTDESAIKSNQSEPDNTGLSGASELGGSGDNPAQTDTKTDDSGLGNSETKDDVKNRTK